MEPNYFLNVRKLYFADFKYMQTHMLGTIFSVWTIYSNDVLV